MRPFFQEEALLQKKKYKIQITVWSGTQGQQSYFWRLVLWSDETKM